MDQHAGHGDGTPTGKQIEKQIDLLSFLVKSLDVRLR